MFKLYIEKKEVYNEKTKEFEIVDSCTISLEHSLVSISKWEAKWHKSFLNTDDKTNEELIDYVKCMTISQNVDPKIYFTLSIEEIKQINVYIGDSMSATTFSDMRPEGSSPKKKDVITSELIYYWLVAYQIPFECQRWHLNRLLTLIKICSIKNSSGKDDKMSKRSTMSSNRALNAARRQAYNTKG